MCFFFLIWWGWGKLVGCTPPLVSPRVRAQRRIVEIPDRKTMQEAIYQEEEYLA